MGSKERGPFDPIENWRISLRQNVALSIRLKNRILCITMNTKNSLTFPDALAEKMDKSLRIINSATLINNKKIKEFHARSEKMHSDVQDLATIFSTQLMVLEEKYKMLHALVTDIYTRLDHTTEEKNHV